MRAEHLQHKFPSFENVVDAYIPTRIARKSGMKYGFVRVNSKEEGGKAILSTH